MDYETGTSGTPDIYKWDGTESGITFGVGWGARSYKGLLIVNSQKIMDKLKGGTWIFEAGAEASVGTAVAEGATGNTGFTTHILADGGASATVTARVIRISVNKSLID